MPRSMTAFNRGERVEDWGKLSWELRSVNHRYLDVSPRIPEELRRIEPTVRERIGKRVSRGKVECTLRFESALAVGEVEVNWDYAEKLIEVGKGLQGKLGLAATSMDPLDLLRMPGVLADSTRDLNPVLEAALELLDETLDGFVAARQREGIRLAGIVAERVEKLAAVTETLRQQLPAIRQRQRERLEQRLAELEQPADPGRLEQELVYMAQRMDVDEELDRLVSHVEEIRRTLKREEPVGRRLDFLMQELNREANTLGSKSAALESTNTSVEMKVLIEQMREQIQNLE